MLECDATPIQLEASRRAKAIRQGLRRPALAKQDTPIQLKRPTGITGYQVEINAREAAAKAERERLRKSKELQEAIIAKMANEIQRIEDQERDWLLVNHSRENSFPQFFLTYIKRVVATEFGINVSGIDSQRRTQNFIIPRHVAIFLVKELMLHKSLPQIGRAFDGRDHTTILHACRRIPGRMRADAELCQRVVWLQGKIEDELQRWRVGA